MSKGVKRGCYKSFGFFPLLIVVLNFVFLCILGFKDRWETFIPLVGLITWGLHFIVPIPHVGGQQDHDSAEFLTVRSLLGSYPCIGNICSLLSHGCSSVRVALERAFQLF
jgi:hypothetical protein